MSSGELILTLFVALVVFGPNKLPMLAEHLGKLYRFFKLCRNQLGSAWEKLVSEQQLLENQKKAAAADKQYQ